MERQEDVRYMQQQAAQLDKQERERQQLLERVRAVQVRGRVGGLLPTLVCKSGRVAKGVQL